MSKIYKKNSFDRWTIPLYKRLIFYISLFFVFSLLLSFLLSVYFNNIILILLIGSLIILAILSVIKIYTMILKIKAHNGYHFYSVKTEKQLINSLVDTMSLNTIKRTNRIEVPDVQVELKHNGSFARAITWLERLPNMDNVEILIKIVSNSFRGKYKNLAVVDYIESDDFLSYTFYLEDVNIDKTIVVSDIQDLVQDKAYKIKIQSDTIIDFRKNPHFLISGKTGSGKSTFLLSIILQIMYHINIDDEQSTRLYIVDPKKEFSSFDFMVDYIYSEKDIILNKMVEFVTILEEREKIVARKISEIDKLGATAIDLGFNPIFIVVEEISAVVASFDNKELKIWDNCLKQLLMKGRSTGIFVIGLLQYAGSTSINIASRNQFSKILLGSSSKEDIQFMFGNNNETVKNTVEPFKGYMLIDGTHNTPQKMYVADIRKVAEVSYFRKVFLKKVY